MPEAREAAPKQPHRHSRPRPKGFKKGRRRCSEMVFERIQDTNALTGSIRSTKVRIRDGFGEKLEPELGDGETLPDAVAMLDLVGRSVETALEKLIAADREYADVLANCAHLSRECDRVAKELYPRAMEVRRSIDSVFGKSKAARIHGLEGRILRKPPRLHHQMQYMMLHLRDGDFEMPEPEVPGYRVERGAWLAAIEPSFVALEELLGRRHSEWAGRDFYCVERQGALKAFDAAYKVALRFVDAAYGLAGCPRRTHEVLRPQYKVRRLNRWARERREERRKKRQAKATGSPSAAKAPVGKALRATLCRWFATARRRSA